MGPDCNMCRPFYNDRPWARATELDGMECLRKFDILMCSYEFFCATGGERIWGSTGIGTQGLRNTIPAF